MVGFFYLVVGYWCWVGLFGEEMMGWFGCLGFVDFVGSIVVYSVGGWIVLVAVLIIGLCVGCFFEEGDVCCFNANNLLFSVLGALLLWFGWFGFNGGSVLCFDVFVLVVL